MSLFTITNYFNIGIIILFLLIAISIIKYMSRQEESKSSKRKRQSALLYSVDSAVKRIEKRFESAPIRKKVVYEKIIAQAGEKISYETLMVRRILFGAAGFLIGSILLKNLVMSIVFSIVGYSGYWEYIKFMRNKRIEKIDSQIGPFLNILTERYIMTNDIISSIGDCVREFEGLEPLHSEIKRTYYKITSGGETVEEALKVFAARSGNVFMMNFAKYYSVENEIGTSEVKNNLLPQAFNQYEKNRKMKVRLKRKISEPVKTAYMMVGGLIGTLIYQSIITEDFWKIISKTWYGNLILAFVCAVALSSIWIINIKLGGTIDVREIKNKKNK